MVFLAEAIPALSQGQMSNIWLMAHFQKKVNKRQIKKTNISKACEGLTNSTSAEQNIPLRHYGQCLLGLSRIHLKQVEYLHADCTDAVSKLKITFKKSNVDLPPKGDEKRRDAITLGNRNDNDNTLFLNVDQSGDNENDQLSDLGNTLGTLALGDTGSGSHGLGMMATSTLDNINNMQHLNNIDAESLSGFGSVSGIEAAAKSNLNQYQAKTHEITLNESESHISADSTVRRISLGTGTQNLPYDEIQDDCDIEIDFDDNEQEEFDENDAESVGDMEVEAGRAAIDSINISNVNLNDNNNDNDSVDDGMQSIEQLSAIKGPKPDIDVSVSDVASVASVASGVSIPSVGSDENMDNGNDNNGMAQVPLDESMGLPLDGGMVPQLDANAAVDDNASVASVASMRSEESLSTVELEEQRRKRQKRMRRDNDNDNDNNENDNENENDTDNENEDDGRSPRAQRKKKGSRAVKGGKAGKAGKAAKRYKKSRKPRFVEEVGDNGQIEMDHNVGVNGQRDSYILPERDILHIWRERSMRDLTYDEMMRYPISMANELFGGGFGANYGNIIHEYQRYMPKHVLKCYNDILNKKRVPGVRHDDNDNLNESRTQDDMLGDMFDPAEIGRRGRENDNDNNYDSENAFDDNDDNPDVSPLIGQNDSDLMMHNSSHEQESYLKQHKLDFNNNDNTSIMNTTVLDAVVDDNILNLNASLAADENASHRHPIVEIVQEDAASLQNANLDSDNEDDKNDDEEEDDDIDIEVNNNNNDNDNDDENANENENKIEENNNNLQSQSQNQSQKNASQTKYRSWSRRTQKTLQYLNNKEGNGFSFNEMMQESNKRETVAGVFYEMLVLKNANLIELEQEKCFEDITITKTSEFDEYVGKVRMVRMSQF